MAKKDKSTDEKNEQGEDKDLAYSPPPAAWDEGAEESDDEDDVEESEDDEDEDEDEDEDVEESDDEDEDVEESDDEYDEDDEYEEYEDDTYEEEDPNWFVPHLVLVALLLLGLLGHIGVFNNTLRPALPFLTKHRTAQAKASIEARKSAGKTTAKQPKRVPAKPRPKVQKKRPTGAIYGAKHILVAYKGARRASPKIKRSKDEAKKLAAKVVKQARADKKAWPKLVKTHSDEPGAARRQGDLGRFRKGSMVPQFQTAVEKLKVGGVSEVVETAFGYHVIWRTL